MRFVRFLVVALSIMLLASTLTGCGSKETQQDSARFTDGQVQIAEAPGRKFDGSPAAGSGVTPTSVGDDAHSVWVDVENWISPAWGWLGANIAPPVIWVFTFIGVGLVYAFVGHWLAGNFELYVEGGIFLIFGLIFRAYVDQPYKSLGWLLISLGLGQIAIGLFGAGNGKWKFALAGILAVLFLWIRFG